jgi:hypothetical protein
MQKRGFKRGKGVASDQFPIEIGRRVKTKKKPSVSWAKKNPPKGIRLDRVMETAENIAKLRTYLYTIESGIIGTKPTN